MPPRREGVLTEQEVLRGEAAVVGNKDETGLADADRAAGGAGGEGEFARALDVLVIEAVGPDMARASPSRPLLPLRVLALIRVSSPPRARSSHWSASPNRVLMTLMPGVPL
jgi:hypothetical protein